MSQLNLLLTGACDQVGKTTIGCFLGFAFAARGLRVGVMKPVETGCAEVGGALEPADARGLATLASCSLPLELICPYRYRAALAPAPAAQSDGAPLPDLERIADRFAEISAGSDIVLVEDQGGLSAPINWQFDYAQLAERLALRLLVVVSNHAEQLAPVEAIVRVAAQRRLSVAGFLLNDIEPPLAGREFDPQWLVRMFPEVAYLGRVRHKEPLGISVVEGLLAESRMRI